MLLQEERDKRFRTSNRERLKKETCLSYSTIWKMVDIIWDAGFKRSYKKRIANDDLLKKKFREAMIIFANNQFDSRLKTHKLTGKLKGLSAFSVSYDCRVVFKFEENNKSILLIDIGTHDEVY
jgi:addiction module RelE/StbE family toxin